MNAKKMTKITDPDLASQVTRWESEEHMVPVFDNTDEDPVTSDLDWDSVNDMEDAYREFMYA